MAHAIGLEDGIDLIDIEVGAVGILLKKSLVGFSREVEAAGRSWFVLWLARAERADAERCGERCARRGVSK